ncbi:heterokaryon incompatibility protein-domain-containing protein [Podospora didyma]|uniref:Heterokaryon incompatibility protein-domain-containing protein n=1 Tax=Podospora didyma TaxID=330526 RepID=A0AAE0K5R5_9PEZI|nr:heterokaryon incompatibility protein-domain-containing protein [Podospora didyma]
MVRYDALDVDTAEIRLLELLPGERDAPIQCKLKTASLQRKPTFEALSYVWGDSTVRRPITVDFDILPVTTNLEEALRALRRLLESRTLWVDAICINQDDVGEKNTQVPLMGKIYSDATRVVAWLGPSNPAIELAVSFTHFFVEKRYTTKSLNWLKLKLIAVFSDRARAELLLAILRALEGYLEIANCPYWSRMWTYQEFVLPRDEPIAMCGKLEFRATAMGELYHLINKKLNIESLPAGLAGSEKLNAVAKQAEVVRKTTISLPPTDSGFSNLVSVSVSRDNKFLGSTTSLSTTSLYFTTMFTARRHCSEPRDRVYALYGVATEARAAYPPDYSKPVEQIFHETTAFLVNNEGWFPISLGLMNHSALPNTSYPSWVVKFNTFDPVEPKLHSSLGPSVLKSHVPRVSDDLTTLEVPAWNLGPIRVVLKFASNTSSVLLQMREIMRDPTSSWLARDTLVRNSETLLSRIARLFIACFSRKSLQEYFSADDVVDWYRAIPRDGMDDDQIEVLSQKRDITGLCVRATKEIVGMVLFTTKDRGLLGIGDHGTKEDDILTVSPRGVWKPLVLRAESDGSSEGAVGYYRLAGKAVVEGLMDEGDVDTEVVEEFMQQKLERFHIH